ncbi:DUF6714 family protein [Prosthecobacter sp.]|uniref:DUF6714 family protein n=1 Tax=Prosthecobacter sp. TaxID=1965333 RepID=UPI002488F3B7|nr:DUF6714 family protein [Prosthecobacter sp.]MDI1315026.1 hypothetical protein [Prosthecobacter sp.]
MKYPTAEEIAEMKVCGYEAETIRLAGQQMERGKEAMKLCGIIETAFHDVKLGTGIGLHEALGLDDYANAATCAAYREKDEKEDWRRIAAEELNGCHSSLSFFDAEGMRFHLPAFLILELQGFGMGITFHLAHAIVVDQTKFSLLSPEQRLSVRMFLLFLLRDPGESFDHPHIQHALDFYWVCPPS